MTSNTPHGTNTPSRVERTQESPHTIRRRKAKTGAGLLATLLLGTLLLPRPLVFAQTMTPTAISVVGGPVFQGGKQSFNVSIKLPSQTVLNKVDVFFLFDDTGSFSSVSTSVIPIFSGLVGDLETALPSVSFAYGVGRFEDFGGAGSGFSGDSQTARPFILNQPIVTAATAGGASARNALISTALNNTAPGSGGDGPESALEGLFQVATGAGFDGDGNGSRLDSGAAGASATQTTPGISGDVPPFSSNVLPVSGTLGGAGFRNGALHLVICATDIASVAPFPAGSAIPARILGGGGSSEPANAFAYSSTTAGEGRFGFVGNSVASGTNTIAGAVAPAGSATVQGTVTALNALGIRVLGMGPSATPTSAGGPSGSPNVWLSAIARLTGAVDADGQALVFSTSGSQQALRDAIVNAVQTTTTQPVDIGVTHSNLPPGLTVTATPNLRAATPPGGTANFTVMLSGSGPEIEGAFDLNFSDVNSGAILGSIPVTLTSVGPKTFNGALADVDTHSGSVTVTLNDNGSFSGKIILDAVKTFPISGALGTDGSFSTSITGVGFVELQLIAGTPALFHVVVAQASRVYEGTAVRSPFSTSRPAPQAGLYTALLQPSTAGATNSAVPHGVGFATGTVERSGNARFVGRTGDGATFGAGSGMRGDGTLPFQAALYPGRLGSLKGKLTFRNQTGSNPSDFDGALTWVKPATPGDPFYPAGIPGGTTVDAIGSRYVAPPTQQNKVLRLDTAGTVGIRLKEGNLLATGEGTAVIPATGDPRVSRPVRSLAIVKSTGLFTGYFAHDADGASRLFRGAFFQKQNLGAGFFLGTNLAGAVELTPVNSVSHWRFDNFANLADLAINGTATSLNPTPGPATARVLRLTDTAPSPETSSAFFKTTVPLKVGAAKLSFSTAFRFQLSGSTGASDADGAGGGGLAFLLTTTPNALGGTGAGPGYQGISPSIAVEFDTFSDSLVDGGSGNHVGLNLNGNLTSIASIPIARRMNDGMIWYAWIDYDALTNRLDIRVAPTSVRPAAATLSRIVDIVGTLGQSNAFAGFTAATGSGQNVQDVRFWQFDTF
jgi:hypothetical protein